MFEFPDAEPTNVGWSNQLLEPAVGLYPAANTLSNVYWTLYVIVPVTITARPMLVGAT
jgi:hypothetical protein